MTTLGFALLITLAAMIGKWACGLAVRDGESTLAWAGRNVSPGRNRA